MDSTQPTLWFHCHNLDSEMDAFSAVFHEIWLKFPVHVNIFSILCILSVFPHSFGSYKPQLFALWMLSIQQSPDVTSAIRRCLNNLPRNSRDVVFCPKSAVKFDVSREISYALKRTLKKLKKSLYLHSECQSHNFNRCRTLMSMTITCTNIH